VCALVIALLMQLINSRTNQRVAELEQQTQVLSEKLQLATAGSSATSGNAPGAGRALDQESREGTASGSGSGEGATSQEGGRTASDLARFKITLADRLGQEEEVRGYLAQPSSGYPTLVEAIGRVMKGRRFLEKAVPLMVINHQNLVAHGRGDGEPIMDVAEIDPAKLKQALLASWRTKNFDPKTRPFEKVVVPTGTR
jgi:hypothetical protein